MTQKSLYDFEIDLNMYEEINIQNNTSSTDIKSYIPIPEIFHNILPKQIQTKYSYTTHIEKLIAIIKDTCNIDIVECYNPSNNNIIQFTGDKLILNIDPPTLIRPSKFYKNFRFACYTEALYIINESLCYETNTLPSRAFDNSIWTETITMIKTLKSKESWHQFALAA